MYDLKPLSRGAVPAALERATRYRLLNEPVEAESICLDVLEVEPENQEALRILLLALTEQFEERLGMAVREATELLPRIRDAYTRAYLTGIVHERRAKAHHAQGGPGSGHIAYEEYRRAMQCYEEALAQRPPDNDEAILRWNTCARILMRHGELRPAPADTFQALLE